MLLFLMATAALSPAGPELNRGVNPRILAEALSAPESERKPGEKSRYCVFLSERQLAVSGQRADADRRICRTRREWVALGVEPLTS